MKKILFLVIFVFLISISLSGENRFFLGVSGGYYNFSDSSFKDIYNDGTTIYGGIFGVHVWKEMQIVGSFKFLSMDGKTTYTKEDLKFSMSPITVALRYKFGKNSWKVNPYLGAGFDYYPYKEDVVNETEFLKDTSESVFGYSIQGGFSAIILKNLTIDGNLKYTVADAKPYETKVKLGGFEIGIGLLFAF